MALTQNAINNGTTQVKFIQDEVLCFLQHAFFSLQLPPVDIETICVAFYNAEDLLPSYRWAWDNFSEYLTDNMVAKLTGKSNQVRVIVKRLIDIVSVLDKYYAIDLNRLPPYKPTAIEKAKSWEKALEQSSSLKSIKDSLGVMSTTINEGQEKISSQIDKFTSLIKDKQQELQNLIRKSTRDDSLESSEGTKRPVKRNLQVPDDESLTVQMAIPPKRSRLTYAQVANLKNSEAGPSQLNLRKETGNSMAKPNLEKFRRDSFSQTVKQNKTIHKYVAGTSDKHLMPSLRIVSQPQPRVHLALSGVCKDTEKEEIINLLDTLQFKNPGAEKIASKYPDSKYAVFHIWFDKDNTKTFDYYTLPELWPCGIKIRRWGFMRTSRTKSIDLNSQNITKRKPYQEMDLNDSSTHMEDVFDEDQHEE